MAERNGCGAAATRGAILKQLLFAYYLWAKSWQKYCRVRCITCLPRVSGRGRADIQHFLPGKDLMRLVHYSDFPLESGGLCRPKTTRSQWTWVAGL